MRFFLRLPKQFSFRHSSLLSTHPHAQPCMQACSVSALTRGSKNRPCDPSTNHQQQCGLPIPQTRAEATSPGQKQSRAKPTRAEPASPVRTLASSTLDDARSRLYCTGEAGSSLTGRQLASRARHLQPFIDCLLATFLQHEVVVARGRALEEERERLRCVALRCVASASHGSPYYTYPGIHTSPRMGNESSMTAGTRNKDWGYVRPGINPTWRENTAQTRFAPRWGKRRRVGDLVGIFFLFFPAGWLVKWYLLLVFLRGRWWLAILVEREQTFSRIRRFASAQRTGLMTSSLYNTLLSLYFPSLPCLLSPPELSAWGIYPFLVIHGLLRRPCCQANMYFGWDLHVEKDGCHMRTADQRYSGSSTFGRISNPPT